MLPERHNDLPYRPIGSTRYTALLGGYPRSRHHFNYDAYDQHYRLENQTELPLIKAFAKEAVPGAYAQYTLNLNDQWMLMAGLRGDYSNEHGFFVIPRAHLKYNPNEYVHFRLSAGKGYRTNHVLAENNYLLSSSRKVEIAKGLDMEEAWNYGASVST